MEINKVTGVHARDTYYKIKHSSGLDIFIYPKMEFSTTYAVFGTKYGSIDNVFKRSDEISTEAVPEGIAHYLEHKLFESEDEDAFELFAKTGASANAFTSFESTCYLFSCTDMFYESLEILLGFVQNPYFTKETIAKEQGIIAQEIKMYEDDPQWRVTFNYLKAMYHNHTIKDDIAGTVESIAKITPELLYKCYNTFYNLNNMALCLVGNVDTDKVLKICDSLLKFAEPVTIERIFEDEPNTVVKDYIEQKLSVAFPLFQFGYKEEIGGEMKSEKDIAAVEVLLDIIASDSSPLFKKLLDEGLINETSFSYEYFEGAGYATVFFDGESKNPHRTVELIAAEIERYKLEGIPKEDFERSKKSLYGSNISMLNSTASIANVIVSLNFKDREFFTYIDAFSSLELSDVEDKLKEIFNSDRTVLSTIFPN